MWGSTNKHFYTPPEYDKKIEYSNEVLCPFLHSYHMSVGVKFVWNLTTCFNNYPRFMALESDKAFVQFCLLNPSNTPKKLVQTMWLYWRNSSWIKLFHKKISEKL